MYTVTLSDETFDRLKSLAEPFVDTPETLVAKLIRAEAERRGNGTNAKSASGSVITGAIHLSPDAHESLKFTRLLSAEVEGQSIHRPKWNSLLDHLHVIGIPKLGSFEALRKASGANLRSGKYEENGYRYVPEIDISIQGVDANLAWDHSLRLARALRVGLRAVFEWRNKEGAAHPGQQGIIEWSPNNDKDD